MNNDDYIPVLYAQQELELPLSLIEIVNRFAHTPWVLSILGDRLRKAGLTRPTFDSFYERVPQLLEELKQGIAPKALARSKTKKQLPVFKKLYELVNDCEQIIPEDLELFLRVKKSKLWMQNPLEDVINLEKTKYTSPEIREALEARKKTFENEWNSIQYQLNEINATEGQVIGWKKGVEEFWQKNPEVYFADWKNVRVEKKAGKPRFVTYHSNHISPQYVVQEYQQIKSFLPVAELRKNSQFLKDIEFLCKELKPEHIIYSSNQSARFSFLDDQNIASLLSQQEGLVEKTIIENAANIRKDLPYYKKALSLRQQFDGVMKKIEKPEMHFCDKQCQKWNVQEEWVCQYLKQVFNRITADVKAGKLGAGACQLINGQAEGKFYEYHKVESRFVPRLSRAYGATGLVQETLERWAQSHDTRYVRFRFAVTGQSLHVDIWQKVKERLDDQYTRCKDNGWSYITEKQYTKLYPYVIQRLEKIFDEELLRFEPKTAPSPKQSE